MIVAFALVIGLCTVLLTITSDNVPEFLTVTGQDRQSANEVMAR